MTERMDRLDSNVSPLRIGHDDVAAAEERLVRLVDAPIDVEGTWLLVRDGMGLDHGVTKLRARRRRIRSVILGVAAALVISGAALAAAWQGGPVTAPVRPPGLPTHHGAKPSATFTPSAGTGARTGTTSSSAATGSTTTTDGPSEQPSSDQTGQSQQGQDQQGQDQGSSDPTTGQDPGQDQSGPADGDASSSSAGDTSQGGDGNQSSSPPSDSQS